MFGGYIVQSDLRVEKLAAQVLLPLGFILIIAPNILEPQSWWRWGALLYWDILFLFVMAVIAIDRRVIFTGHERLPKDRKKASRIARNALRIASVPLGLMFFYFSFVPLVADTYNVLLKDENVIVATHTVEHAKAGLGGAWFIGQRVTIEERGVEDDIFLKFSGGVRVGETYEFTYLPRSREVIEYHKVE